MNGYDETEGALAASPTDGTAEPGAFGDGPDAAAPHDGSLPQAAETPAALAARLVEYQRRRSMLFEWMHPLRLAGVPYGEHVRARGTHETAALAEAFLETLGMPAPPLASFGAPGAALALLPAKECLTVFRLRALCDRVEEVRSWIDRPRRKLLSDWIGPHGVRLLLESRHAFSGHATPLIRHKPLGAADGDALAWLGFRLFEYECGWPPDNPLAIVQLAMPADAAGASPRALQAAPRGHRSRSIVSQLPNLFPEWSW